jgi:uncharacterized protein (TIGR03086 family)
MTWTANIVYTEGLDVFTGVVESLSPADWEQPSPCAGWRAFDVLGHVGATTEFGTRLLTTGEMVWVPPADPPGSLVEGDPAAWWTAMVPGARAALEGVDLTRTVETPMGVRTIAEGLAFPAIDLFVHAWDIGAVAGRAPALPDELLEFAHATFASIPEEMMRSGTVFGPAVAAPPGASASDEFLAWSGRDPAWRPPS